MRYRVTIELLDDSGTAIDARSVATSYFSDEDGVIDTQEVGAALCVVLEHMCPRVMLLLSHAIESLDHTCEQDDPGFAEAARNTIQNWEEYDDANTMR